MDFDFGLTALGGRFHMDWVHSGANPREVVRGWADLVGVDEDGLEELRLLRRDVLMLLASPLSDEEVHALWRAAARYYPDFPVEENEPARGRVWLTEIDHELHPFLGDSAHEALAMESVNDSVQSAVIALAESLTPRSELPLEPLPAKSVVAAVERCAREVSPSLAFRFLLRAYSAYDSPVPASLWPRFEEVNQAFGYGEFMLSTIEYLLEE
ncbi:hypothetical protein [Streptomyces sp. NPDC001404]|uniref:hypothetical protein n=1 Tax=Streptomyces sp. NPDC001404 TaxID=3364571 RepID=UPI0036A96C33